MYTCIYAEVKIKIFLSSVWVSKPFILALDSSQDIGIEFLLHKKSYEISVATRSPNPHFYVVKRFPVAQCSEAANKGLLLTSVLNGIYAFNFHFAQAVSLIVSKSWCRSCITPIRKKQHGHSSRLDGEFPPHSQKNLISSIFIFHLFFEEEIVSIISSCGFPEFDKKMPGAPKNICINLAHHLSVFHVCFKVKDND